MHSRASDPNEFKLNSSQQLVDGSLMQVNEVSSAAEEEDQHSVDEQIPADMTEGEHQFESGAVYRGMWLNRARHGYGEQIWPDGAKYQGEWQDN